MHHWSNRRGPIAAVLATAVLAVPVSLTAGRNQPYVEDKRFDFVLPDLNGETVKASDERFVDNVLFVTLWATWCAPCLTEISTFIELQEEYGDRGLVIVAIAFEQVQPDSARRAHLRSFAEKKGINYLILDGGPPKQFETALPMVKKVKGLPVEIVVDRSGRVTSTRNGFGYKEKWEKKIREEVERLLGVEPD